MDSARIAALANEIVAAATASATNQYWVGIAGAPGSGKTTLVTDLVLELQAAHGLATTGIPMDGYHYSRAELDTFENPEKGHRFRGAPFTFNGDRFVQDLQAAKAKGSFSFPGFDHKQKDPVPDMHHITTSSQVVLVEGNYLLLDETPWSSLADGLFDEMWYLQCELNELKRRLAQRHMASWGWTLEQALSRIEDSDGKNMVTVTTSKGLERATKVVHSVTVIDACLHVEGSSSSSM